MYMQSQKTRTWLTGLALSFALAFLLLVNPVYAEGELPPEEPAPTSEEDESLETTGETPTESDPEPVEPSVEEPLSEPLPEGTAEEPVSDLNDEPALVVEEPVSASDAVEGEADPLPLEALIEELAETDLVLADSSGEILDLASGETVEALSGADPYWTVGTTLYAVVKNALFCPPGTTFGITCWVDANPIFYALGQIGTPGFFPTDGFLYVEGDTYNESITINGGALASLKGIIGVDGSAATILNGTVNIQNTIAGFTLKGFTINGRLLMSNNTGTLNLTDLDVNYTVSALAPINVFNHNGAINVTWVKSSGNRGNNSFENTAGTGNITITNSAFDHNNPASAGLYAHGVYINTLGSVTLDGVSASGNNGSGLYILQGNNLTIKNSVFNNNYGTPDNGGAGYGVTAAMNGNIILTQVIANDNERTGLDLSTMKAVTFTDVTANGNDVYGYGAKINVYYGTGAVKISHSHFSDNAYTGLHIDAKGAVTLTSITAEDNNWFGTLVDNCQWNGSACSGTGAVTVTSLASKGELFANRFNGNGYAGLAVYSKSNVLVENFIASDNTTNEGVYIENSNGSGNVTVKATLANWLNQTINNGSYGVRIFSKGSVLIDKVHSADNTSSGIQINSINAPTMKPVTVQNVSIHNNSFYGIYIETRGLVTLMNVDVRDHTGGTLYGALIDNTYGTGGVTIKASSGKTNFFVNNSGDGVYIDTNGPVYISDAQSIDNGGYGFRIFAEPITGLPPVTLLRTSADSNNQSGVQIFAYGPISLTNVTSTNHSNTVGAYVSNAGSSGTPGVTVKDSVFSYNKYDGLDVYSKGAVTITNIDASHSVQGTGLSVDNCQWDGSMCTGVGGITLTATKGKENTFISNYSSGLSLYSNLNISMTNLRVEYNGNTGIYASNDNSGSSGNITIKAISGYTNHFNYNGEGGAGYGLDLSSRGTITLSRVNSEHNNGRGAYIYNSNALSPKSILITDSVFSNNQGNGLEASSLGLISLKGVDASDNSVQDWVIDFAGQTANDFLSTNHGEDIWKFSSTNGAPVNIILQSIYFDAFVELRDANWSLIASDDNSYGSNNAQIITNLPSTGDFYLVVSSALGGENGQYRLSLNDPTQTMNIYYYFSGAILSNTSGEAGVSILPSGSGIGGTFRQNNISGLSISTNGVITLNKVWAEENGADGVNGYNNTGTNKNIAITNGYFNNNHNYGAQFYTAGNFSWNGGGASGNAYYGFYLDGDSATTANTATISNASFDDNNSNGFRIYVYGNVTLNTVNASDNFSSGGFVDNCRWNGSGCDGTGNVTITSPTGNTFNSNGYQGITIITNGITKLTNINANSNTDNGVSIDSTNNTGSFSLQNPGTKMINTISDNGGFGVYLNSLGTILVNKVTSENNYYSNLYLVTTSNAASAVTLTNSATNGSDLSDGFFIQSDGGVIVKAVSASNNYNRGGYVDTFANQNALVTTSIFNNNGYFGLEVNSDGNVTLNAITVNGNDDVGLRVSNTTGSGKVEILSTLGENFFNGNAYHGMYITTNGDVTLSKVTANSNGFMGINISSSGPSGLIKLDTITTKTNGFSGISLFSNGKVIINKATSLYNGTSNNTDGLNVTTNSADGVTITNSYFIGNEGSGIEANVTTVNLVFITNTVYLGNDSDNTGDLDLNIY